MYSLACSFRFVPRDPICIIQAKIPTSLPPLGATNLLASLSELYSRHDRVGRGMAVVNGFSINHNKINLQFQAYKDQECKLSVVSLHYQSENK